MHRRNAIMILIVIGLFLGNGCAHVISKDLRDRVEKDMTFKGVLKDPAAYKGKTVIWGGVIIEAKNLKEGTLIEILQKPIGFQGQPEDVDRSDGRFLALFEGFLDVAIYAKGREVTVAGEIKGKRIQPLGELEYTYPLITVKEIHLWPDRSKERIIYLPSYWDFHPSLWYTYR